MSDDDEKQAVAVATIAAVAIVFLLMLFLMWVQFWGEDPSLLNPDQKDKFPPDYVDPFDQYEPL